MYFRRDNRLRRNSFHRLIVFFDAVYLNRLDFYMGRNTRAPPPPSVDVPFQSFRVNLREICANA